MEVESQKVWQGRLDLYTCAGHAIVYALGRLVGLPMSDQQLKSFLRRVLKGFSARNYRITPRLWQPDFGWDHSGVPLAFSMALTTYSGLFDGIKR